jgi:hypothetical protein
MSGCWPSARHEPDDKAGRAGSYEAHEGAKSCDAAPREALVPYEADASCGHAGYAQRHPGGLGYWTPPRQTATATPSAMSSAMGGQTLARPWGAPACGGKPDGSRPPWGTAASAMMRGTLRHGHRCAGRAVPCRLLGNQCVATRSSPPSARTESAECGKCADGVVPTVDA